MTHAPRGCWFLQTDPIGYEDDLNLYHYVGNDPLNLIDQTGLRPGDRFATAEEAAVDAILYINPRSIQENMEYAGRVDFVDGSYVATEPVQQERSTFSIRVFESRTVAIFHTHGDYSTILNGRYFPSTAAADCCASDEFSVDDIDEATTVMRSLSRRNEFRSYLGTPSGIIRYYQPRGRTRGTVATAEEGSNHNAEEPASNSSEGCPSQRALGPDVVCGGGINVNE